MITEAQKKANSKYDKSHTKSVMLKLNKQTDADAYRDYHEQLGILRSAAPVYEKSEEPRGKDREKHKEKINRLSPTVEYYADYQ